MVGKNQKRSFLWHKIIWNSNLGTQLYLANDSFWTSTAEYSSDRDGVASATSSIYYMALSIKSVSAGTGSLEYKPRASSTPHRGSTATSLLWGRLNQNLLLASWCLWNVLMAATFMKWQNVVCCCCFYNIYTFESSRWSLLKGQRS